jgi:nucleotide-binding universal stress UspA family protein
MYKRILVPVDGSAASMLGLQQAVRFAKDQRAHLRIIHVVDEAVLAQYPELADTTGQLLEAFINDGKKTLNDAMALARRLGIRAERVLYQKLLGPLADVILKEAKKWRADIIVMGTHGQSGIRHFFLGSDAETIARSTLLPVLLIHGAPSAKRKRAARRKSGNAPK